MATFIGYNTIGQYKNYVLTDFELVKRDLLNAFSIRQGEVPGRPTVGTTIWNLMFESQTPETTQQVYDEIQRVVAQDPRIFITQAQVYTQQNGMLIELEIDTRDGAEPQMLAILFDEVSRSASYV